jgi:alanine dehydrogenase
MAGTQRAPSNIKGTIAKMGGNVFNYGFIGVDTFSRIKSGESAPVAIGKALLTNAAFSLIPGGIVGVAAIGVAMAAPEIINQMDAAAGNLNNKKKQFGGNFQESETQMMSLQNNVSSMQNARMQATRRMANHARGAQKVY